MCCFVDVLDGLRDLDDALGVLSNPAACGAHLDVEPLEDGFDAPSNSPAATASLTSAEMAARSLLVASMVTLAARTSAAASLGDL